MEVLEDGNNDCTFTSGWWCWACHTQHDKKIKKQGSLCTAGEIVSTAAVIAMTKERENGLCQRK